MADSARALLLSVGLSESALLLPIIMEEQLNFGLKMTLEQLALQRVASNIWNEKDILESIEKYQSMKLSKKESTKVWQETVEDKVKEKISQLVIIESFKKQMIHLIRPMGLDLLKWIWFNRKQFFCLRGIFDVPILEQLCRTDKGVIDYKKTAIKLVSLQTLHVQKRYQFACFYCLVDYIPALWEEIDETVKKDYCNEGNSLPITNMHMDYYWAYIYNGEESKLHDIVGSCFNLFAFECSAHRGNKAAIEYFYQKLTAEKQESYLFSTFRTVIMSLQHSEWLWEFQNESIADGLCYLFTLMNPEQQMQVLKEYPCDILNCFLDWSWPDFFLDMADIVWTFLPESNYDALLSLLNERVENSGYYSPEFFQKFFLRSPMAFRKRFARKSADVFFSLFLITEDTESIKVFFRNMEVSDRIYVAKSFMFNGVFGYLMTKDKWHLIKLCFQESTLFEKGKKKVRKLFFKLTETKIHGIPSVRLRKTHRDQFLQFLDDMYSGSGNKRSSDLETPNNAKKVCREEERNTSTIEAFPLNCKERFQFPLQFLDKSID